MTTVNTEPTIIRAPESLMIYLSRHTVVVDIMMNNKKRCGRRCTSEITCKCSVTAAVKVGLSWPISIRLVGIVIRRDDNTWTPFGVHNDDRASAVCDGLASFVDIIAIFVLSQSINPSMQ
jgi:hypothetical protein